VGGSLFRIGIGALPFLLPMMLQLTFGLTPFASGLLTFASAAGAMTMKMTAAPIIRAVGFRRTLVGNAVICSVFLFANGLFRPSTPHAIIFITLLVGGFFRSLQFTSTNTLSFADVPPAMMSRATSFTSMAQQLSISLGVGLSALLLQIMLTVRGASTLEPSDFMLAFIVVGVIALMPVGLFTRLSPEAGAELSGHRAPTPATSGGSASSASSD
jgi:MFS family permease